MDDGQISTGQDCQGLRKAILIIGLSIAGIFFVWATLNAWQGLDFLDQRDWGTANNRYWFYETKTWTGGDGSASLWAASILLYIISFFVMSFSFNMANYLKKS